MSAYCTVDELSDFGISEDAIGAIEAPKLDAAITGASGLIDSYLKGRFTLPLISWGSDLRRAAAIITVYDVIQTRGYNPNEDSEDDQLRLRYLDVIQWLRDIAAEKATPTVEDSAPGASQVGAARFVSNDSRGWQVPDGSGGAFTGRRS